MSARTENSIWIDAPLDLVWQMTNDVRGWPELFTEYASAEVLRESGNTVLFRLTMHPDEAGRTWSWVSERTADRHLGKVDSHRVETGPFEFMQINWDYREVRGGTEMRWVQEFHMRPDAPVDDVGMRNRIDTNTPIQMNVIKEKIERRHAEVAGGAE